MAIESAASPGPVKAAGTTLDPGMTVSSAFAAIVRDALQHLQANEDGFLSSDDPEYLHQVRVALRRLRSAFSAFSEVLPARAAAPLAAHLEWLGKALGPARDDDVFVTETLPPITKAFDDVAALRSFAAQCASLRGRARGKARRAMATKRYQRLRSTLAAAAVEQSWRERAGTEARAALDAPVCAYAEAELQRGYDRVRKRGRKMAQQSAAEHHRMRVAVKKLRYAVDFFASLFGEDSVRPWRTQLSRLQDILGAMSDAAAARQRVEAMLGSAQAPTAAEARGILLGWSEGRTRTLERELRREWKAFRKCERFW